MFTGDISFNDIVERTKEMLGENYRGDEDNNSEEMTEITEEENTSTILENICEIVIHEAAQWTNRKYDYESQELLNDCWPIIVKCACIAYLNRGAEGLGSQSELGQQNVYTDWVKLLHQQITNRRHVF